MIFEKKNHKNTFSREPKGFEQSNLDSRFATPGCILTAPHDRVENEVRSFFLYLFFDQKNEIIEYAFATPDCTLTSPHYKVEKVKFS